MINKQLFVKDAKTKIGEIVTLYGWVAEIRDIGKLKFIILRDRTGKIQIKLKKGEVDEQLFNIELNKEDVIKVEAKVVESRFAKTGIELEPKTIEILSKVEKKLPIDPEGKIESEFETRLNYRYLDVRKEEIRKIFEIKSKAIESFRNYLIEKEFIEVQPSAIVSAATEGGADLFEIKYFEKKAYLAQSPQLYKQMAVVGGLERVFLTYPVFRAEKHNTTTHLNEIMQMDIEMAFADDEDAMKLLEETFLEINKKVKDFVEQRYGEEFKIVEKVHKISYSKLIDILNNNGEKIEWGEDLSKEHEKKIAEYIGDAVIIYDWPTKIRAFYSMPKEDNEEICKAYDLIYKGLEISSGAQRIHIPNLLEKQIAKKGLDVKDFEFYIDAFKYGAPPHAGWSIGLERLVMKLLDLPNIREAVLFPRDRTRTHP